MAENGAGERRYLLPDGLGSVRQASGESGAVVAYREFDSYGNPVADGGEPYGYTGEWWEDEVGLLYLRARWYRPETGSFLSRDPVETEPAYLYVRGNPVNQIDPNGMEPPTPGPTPVPTPPPPPLPPQPTPPPRPVEGTPVPPGPIPPPVSTPPPFPTPIFICPPLIFSAGGYAEGWSGSFSGGAVVWWNEGSEIVYDFATMERARFTYEGVPPKAADEHARLVGVSLSIIELATTWYAVDLNGFDSWKDLNSEYKERFASVNIGLNTPYAELGGGGMFVWSPNFEVTGIGYFNIAGAGAPVPDTIAASLNWTFYSIAEPDGTAVQYRTGDKITFEDYTRMRNDISTGRYKPPHANEDHRLFPRITQLRNQAAQELEWVWRHYHKPE